MKANEIEIYTLAEGQTFWAVVCNYLGWSPYCTYGYDITKAKNLDPEADKLDMLARVKGMGATIKVDHIFKPFREPELGHCMRRHYDDALSLIRLVLKSGVKVVWDEIPSDEREILLRYSPPLHSIIFSKDKEK